MVTPSSVLFYLLVRETDVGYGASLIEFPAFLTEPASKLRGDVEVGHEMIVNVKAEIRLLDAILQFVKLLQFTVLKQNICEDGTSM
jgi:hypothetical protein